MTDREFATDVVRRLQAAGFRALWAGGCVRDEILGVEPADYDVATDARPEQVQKLFRRTHAVGASFGVIDVLGPRDAAGEWISVQVATFRTDGNYSDGRRPDSVTYSSPEDDAKRRDFTINGMFFDPLTQEIIDYVGGKADLANHVLKAIGDPAARFEEDKLRILRAVRMAARFELSVDSETLAAARRMANQIRVVSVERVAEEFRKMLVNRHRSRALLLMNEFELVRPILPEVGDRFDDATVQRMDNLSGALSFPLAFAVLLNGLDAKAVESITRRLKLANAEADRVSWLVDNSQFLFESLSTPTSRLQPVLVHPGIEDLIALSRATAIASGAVLEPIEFCERILQTTPPEQLNPPPLFTGDDLRAMGLKPGPQFKRLLDAVRAGQLDGALRTADDARAFVRSQTAPA